MNSPQRIIENYPGNKSVKGLYHLIINNIPPHSVFWELFTGSGEITRRKRLAEKTVFNDIDPDVYIKLLSYSQKHPELNLTVLNENALTVLTSFQNTVKAAKFDNFIYCDPPYLDVKPVYKQGHEREFHERLIMSCSTVKAAVMISHYEHPLYDGLVKNSGWRKETFHTVYHGKKVVEAIYMNYKKPTALHDYSFLGGDCWERQLMKRRLNGYLKGLRSLTPVERSRIIEAINSEF